MNQEAPLIYAKSMSGTVYAYAVSTVAEFKRSIAHDHDLTPEFLRVFHPETEEELSRNDPLYPDIVYALFMDTTATPILQEWIRPDWLNPALLIENPSYRPSEQEMARFPPAVAILEYLVMRAPYLDRLEPYFQQLTSIGWRRLFGNPHAPSFLEKTYSLGTWTRQFPEHAPLLANNTHPDTSRLLRRLLSDPTLPPIRRPDLFWQNVARYQSDAISLLDHPMGPGHLTHLDHLCSNPHTVSYFFPLPLCISFDDRRLRWNSLLPLPEATRYLLPLLQQGRLTSPRISYPYLFLNPDPALLVFYRTLPLETFHGSWDTLCKHEDPAYVAFIEEHMEHLPLEAWKTLNRNPSPHALSLLRRHPERIHWSLLCSNPSAEVIPMVEAYLATFEENGFVPFLSTPMESLLGYTLMGYHIREAYQYRDLWHDDHRSTINLGALSLHPHALPLLQRRPELIYPNSFSLRPDIYVSPKGYLA